MSILTILCRFSRIYRHGVQSEHCSCGISCTINCYMVLQLEPGTLEISIIAQLNVTLDSMFIDNWRRRTRVVFFKY